MRKRKKSKNKGRQRSLDFAIVGMLALAVYFAIFGGEYTVFQLNRMEDLERRSAAGLNTIEAQIDSLRVLADLLRDDPGEIERVARERYGMIRDGEILYRFQEDPGEGRD